MSKAEWMIDEHALDWVIRTRDPGFADWETFTAWLEEDPAHLAAYDRLADHDAGLPALIPAEPVGPALPLPANDPGAPGWRRWRIAGLGAVAAALLAVVSVGMFNRSDPYSVTTRPGEQREIALEDGTRIALNGGTLLRLDRKDPRFAALDSGEAVFTVRHDERDPFRVIVGEDVFEDLGTVFNISRDKGVTRIGVAEGAVMFNPGGQGIALLAGRSLRAENGAVTVGTVALAAVAGWRGGRLVYDNAAVEDIAGDIGRTLGVAVRTAGSAGARHFTGTIVLDRNPVRFFSGAAPLLGVKAVRNGKEWVLKEGDAALE